MPRIAARLATLERAQPKPKAWAPVRPEWTEEKAAAVLCILAEATGIETVEGMLAYLEGGDANDSE